MSFTVDIVFSGSVILTSNPIPDQIYRIGDPEILLNVPTYKTSPSGLSAAFIYSIIAPTPSFVNLVGPLDPTS